MQTLISDATYYHHESGNRIANSFPLVKLIYVANIFSSLTRNVNESDRRIAGDILGIDKEEISALAEEANVRLTEMANSFEIDIEPPPGDWNRMTEKDREIEDDLKTQIKYISMLHGTLENLLHAHDINSIIASARNGINILFDLKPILFFLYDKSENMLFSADTGGNDDSYINEMTIPFQDGKSILVTALKSSKVLDSFEIKSENRLSIIDEQLIRMLGNDGTVCFPMKAQGFPVGVLVLAADEADLQDIRKKMDHLRMLLNYAALALHNENIRRAQAKAVLAERFSTTSSMARKVAHEVNNPLSIIKNYLMVLQLKLEDSGISSQEIPIIKDEIDRVSRIIDQLSDLSKPDIKIFTSIDINELLQDTLKLLSAPLAADSIRLELNPGKDIPDITSSRDNLKQVFINLIKNAAEALKTGGNINIATKYQKGAESIQIKIKDDGPGLPETVQARLFEPYTTTKGEGHSGLGLSIVYSIINELKGTVSCTTEKDQGTEFLIVLPLSHDIRK
jgi:signal transduction histidine kinase